jgi:arginine repressor
MTDKVRVALCQYKRDNPQLSQKDLIKWLEDNHNIKVSQATISTTLKRAVEILAKFNNETNLNAKRQRTVSTRKWSSRWSSGFGQTKSEQM